MKNGFHNENLVKNGHFPAMMHVPVLMYHRICKPQEVNAGNDYIVSTEIFELQLQYFIHHGYHTLPIDDLLNPNHQGPPVKKPLVITFDDGYLDTLENAAPLLAKYGFSAIVFVISDFSRQNNWWDLPYNMAEARLMKEDEIIKIRDFGIEIGSHGWSHRSLPLLKDDELAEELHHSKQILEKLLGKPVRYFAYPYGEVDDRVAAFARKSGYQCAFATNYGPWSFFRDLFQIRRTLISNRADALYLNFKLSGAEKGVRWMWSVTKQIVGRRPRYNVR
ncbi:MAG: polysaccharide deacetylase family protein [Bacteroidetes bacterium]|nr:polysaccharide deacetylase family protein [Bacteroidota bacterium]MCW5897589.1 polysaccharide deacetylase family protein [Bacteroidota bacterium]